MGETITKAELLRALGDQRCAGGDRVMVRVIHKDRSDGTCGSYRGEHLPLVGAFAGWADGSWTILAEAGPTELTFEEVRAVNAQRRDRWHPPETDTWSGADWSNAMCGEAGEAANVVKKLRRIETGHVPKDGLGRGDLLAMLGDELADVVLYLMLLADHYEIDLPAAIIDKFNRVSRAQGFPERLPPTWIPDCDLPGASDGDR